MPNNPYLNIINFYKGIVGPMAAGDYTMTVIRPPYTEGSNAGTVVASGAIQCEPSGPNWAQDKIPDAEFYTVCGDPSLFQSGDVLDSGANIPVVTVFSDADGQEFLAMKTDKTCRIEDIGRSWSDLKFDYMNSTSGGPDEYYTEQTSLNNPVRRVIMYGVPGITEAMKFVDEDSGWIWDIAKVDYKFSLLVLYLDQSNRT